MTVGSTTVATAGSNTNGATTQFSFSFRIQDYGAIEAEDQVRVKLVTIATGAETILVRGASAGQYSVSINGDQDASPGGSITTVTTYASGYKIYIELAPSFLQATDYANQGGFLAATVESQHDQQQMQINVLRDRIRRAPYASVAAGSGFDGEINKNLSDNIGRAIVVNEDGSGYDFGGNNFDVTATGSTTARTLAARFADVGNVKDFGAVGDGSTDDTAAIEAALAVWDSIYLPKGVYMLGSRLDVPAGKKIYGAGFDDTILRASATGYNGMTVGSNCVLMDFTIDGNNKGGSYSGILYDGVSGCYTTQVSSINWGADGIAITNAAHHNTFGELHSTNNGSRGIIIDPNSYSNQIGSVDTRGSTNSGLLIGHNSYRNQIGLLICGGHQNSALWIHNAAYENQVDSVVVEAPATGYENNSAILFGWGALRNTIGQATVTGWRRGVQFKGDDADATYTDSDTSYNHIGALYVTTDNGTSAAGVYLDANNGYFAKKNSIGKLHVKSATYGIYDSNGTNYPNFFNVNNATFESVTTPLSTPDRFPAVDSGMKNRLINGAFDINQRLVTAPADDAYVHDRWYVLTQSNPITVGTQTNPENGQANCIRLTQSNASAQRMGLAQIIESVNCIDLRAVVLSLSGRLRCSSAQALRWAVLEWTGTANSVTSDIVADWTSTTYTASNFFIASTSVVASGTLTPTANTWTALTETVGVPTSSANNLIVFVWTSGTAAQNVTLDIGLMQLEAGGSATPFERRTFAAEWAICQRYYEKSFNIGTAPAQNVTVTGASFGVITTVAGNIVIPVTYRVTKRTNATVTLYNPSAANAEVRDVVAAADCSSSSAAQTSASGFRVLAASNAGSANGNTSAIHWSAEAEL